jgi:hypothetical protein
MRSRVKGRREQFGPFRWGLRKKAAALSGLILAAGALVGAIQTIVSNTKPWVCSIGIPLSWCQPPTPPETWSLEVGGSGGEAFTPITCRTGQVMVGLYGRDVGGPVIFSIGPICATAHFSWRQKLASPPTASNKGDYVGTARGNSFELMCPANTVVIGTELRSAIVSTNFGAFNYLVVPLALRCSSVLTSADASLITTVSGAGEPPALASRKPFFCPDGSAAYGIKGRTGQFIDALSLGCRTTSN